MLPNPFNPTTKISFALPEDAHVHLLVYDVRGRLVNVLLEGDQTAGPYDVVWNGTDAAGAPVASGTYFARLETSTGVRSRSWCSPSDLIWIGSPLMVGRLAARAVEEAPMGLLHASLLLRLRPPIQPSFQSSLFLVGG